MGKTKDENLDDKVGSPDVEEKVNQPEGAPIAPDNAGAAVSRETLSHQWQANSPAINTNVLAGYGAANESILDKIDTEENLKAREDAEKVKQDQAEALQSYELIDCSVLDVSDARYCHPGSERHLAYIESIKGKK